MNYHSNLKKDRKTFLILISVLTIIAFFVNIKVHNNYLYNKQFAAYNDKIEIESIELSYRITSHEIIGAINSMAKRSNLLNDILIGRITPDSPLLLGKLGQIKQDYDASIIYVMNKDGLVVACTSYNDNKTLTGNNYSFRPYFTNAIEGFSNIYPAIGVTTGKRGLYYASPIFDIRSNHNSEVLGVLVAKMDLSAVDTLLNNYSYPTAIISSSGNVFSSNVKEWMFSSINNNTDYNSVIYKDITYSVFLAPISLKDESGIWKLISLHKIDKWYKFAQPWLIGFLIIFLYISIIVYVSQYTKKLELELNKRISEEELRAVVASMDDLLFVLDNDNIFINYYQPLTDKRLFTSAEFFIGKSLKETMPPHIVLLAEETIDSVKFTGISRQFEYSLEMEEQIKWYSAKVSMRKNLSGSSSGVTVVVRDISNLKEIEHDLKKSKNIAEEANRAKSDFLANMSHEIRTPMNAILGFTDLLYSTEDNPGKKNKLGMIKTSGQNLLVLINNILDFSKIEAGKIGIENKSFSLRTTLDNMYSMYKGKADDMGLEYTINIEKSVPEFVLGDEHRVIQILTNIIGNALKFTKDGSVTVDLSYNINRAMIKVKDTGIGIQDNKLDYIFSAFSQADSSTERHFGGTGLGLAISKQLVELIGGTVAVKSTLDVGSTFVLDLSLPVIDQKGIKFSKPFLSYNKVEGFEPIDSKFIANHKILVAEDNKMNQALIKAMLQELDFNCDIAENGKIALDKLNAQHYDLLLLDIQMPVMDGLETIKYIRENKNLSNLYVIALTANALIGDSDKYINAGCNDYISKPIDRYILENKISELFRL